ncbi:MAG TPA: CHC2 zinc finger domain-containing protein [Paludibacter sp.]|nr:CHC2 zinc finger domain-containing protein [Paludibacter sp.]
MYEDFYTELKSKNDIMNVAYSLGYNGKKSGNCYQGDCPNHGSSNGVCLVIWPKIQGWKCFHCGAKGDVIDLVMHYKNCDHKTAVGILADRSGISYGDGQTLTAEEIAQKEKDMEEKILVENMLSEATKWYHEQLKDYPEIMDCLLTHYGFSKDIVEELQIGFAPVSNRADNISELAIHLNSIPEFKGKIASTGLFSFSNPSGPYYDYFKGRIVFPYWSNGKVVYQLARATSLTPADKYECYVDKDDNIKIHDGEPEFIKYKKLRHHDPDDEKKKYFSKFIQNDVFMGEDTVRCADVIIIAEGAPDWVSAVDKGFHAISPVTTNFREKDFEKLEKLTRGTKTVYIINDNEDNQAGLKGALRTGKYLTEKGRNVFLVELPRPAGVSKVDLNEYFIDHTTDDLKGLMKNAKSVLEILIDQLPDNFLKAQPYIKEEIEPLMVDMEDGILIHYTGLIAKKCKTTVKVIATDIEAAKLLRKEKEAKKDDVQIDPEIEKGALSLTMDPLVFRKRIDVINRAGVVGERRSIAMYICAIDSRLLPDNFMNPNVLAIKNAGHFGAGKSYCLTMCTQIYPDNAYYMITNGSAKSLYYLQGGLKNKCLIVTEGFQFQENNAADSELVYSIRSLISEGRVSYNTVEKDDNGKLITVDKKLEGPTSFITTTIMENLEPQLEDRLFTIHPDEGIQQTKNIITMTANQRAGTFAGLDDKTIETWRHYHSLLKPVAVVIPFADKIAQHINKNDIVPMSTRRAFKRVLIVIQSVACAYQYQRSKDDQGRLIADHCDYWMALQIVMESFRENMGAPDEKTEARIEFIKGKGKVFPRDIATEYGVSSSSISKWTATNVKNRILTWCDEKGNPFVDDKDLNRAKHSGKACLIIAENYDKKINGLPSPFELTSDPDWDKDGKLLKMYDLKLRKKEKGKQVFDGVNQVFMDDLNTIQDSEPVSSIPETDDEGAGVKVFVGNAGKDKNNFDDPDDVFDGIENDFESAIFKIMNSDNGNGKHLTNVPYICRKGCKYYDRVKDVNTGEIKEFCDMTGKRITIEHTCELVEPKGVKLPEGVLAF